MVGLSHDINRPDIHAYVTLRAAAEPTEPPREGLPCRVRNEIVPIAALGAIRWAPALPNTRSGKTMRRILRKSAANETDSLGDVSTLADPAVVTELVHNRVR